MSSLAEKVETLKLTDVGNVEPKSADYITEPVVGSEDKEEQIVETAQVETKKKNKKKDNTLKAADEIPAPAEPEKETKVLSEVSGNASDENLCAFFKKTGPTKGRFQ